MNAARALVAGPGASRALVDGASGEVALALSGGGAYVRLGLTDWVLLTRPGVAFGPLSVVVDGLDRLSLVPGARAEVAPGRLLVGDRALSLERMRVRRRVGVGLSAGTVRVPLPNPPALLQPGIAALAGARVADGVALLAGLGDGLTPAGDDVLAGYAAARLALGRPVAISAMAAGRASPLGLEYLRCAERGELPEPLSAWGSSSGTAIAWGINAGVFQSTERGVSDARIPVGDLRVQGRGDRRFRRAPRRLVGGTAV